MDIYSLDTYDYHLPPELIAQDPVLPRDACRLLVMDRGTGAISDRFFYQLTDYLDANHILVLNETRVIPARLVGHKETGGQVEVLLLRQDGECWEALVRPARRVRPGMVIRFSDEVKAEVVTELDFCGGRLLRFEGYHNWFQFLEKFGSMPLPPYINRPATAADKLNYQTVYATRPGSAAAPTAGLHFTSELIAKLKKQGVECVSILLHVGLGTFRPVSSSDIREHEMHCEYYEIQPEEARRLNRARNRGQQIVAVGTTVVRTLETAYDDNDGFRAGSGWTNRYIYPGYRFQAVDNLITNFHLPKSSLLMLVCAFAGVEKTLQAYRYAVAKQYRFFSYGDAMFIK
ncbi:MAG: tRNA preQ1(34) S-adenosylmethionine ribosyltransferase-isomerase QueA [Syntrophomonadaceae bacterium]|nr:tRNA preQ1(34) S-adenosylmethionine ribosyltransferase-isomerase QueA [Syntrophomonadaceae bacterium]